MKNVEIITSIMIILLLSIITITFLLFEPIHVTSVHTISWKKLDIVSLDGVKIKVFYVMPPNAKGAVVLLHGFMENSFMWNSSGLVKSLHNSGFSVFMMDLRGHGYSTYYTNGSTLSIDKLSPRDYKLMITDVESLLAIVRGITGNKPLFIIGSDLGGNIAIQLASLMNKTIKGVILVSPILSEKIPFSYQAFENFSGFKCIIYGKYDNYSLEAIKSINNTMGTNISIHSFNNIEHGILLIDVNREALKCVIDTINKWYNSINTKWGGRDQPSSSS